ncbi:MAG: CPBP family intramembrane metalloprotease [Luteolibacter sp.]
MRDVLKVWLYAAVSIVTGAWVAPVFYNAGKALAEVCAAKSTNGVVDTVANVCRAMRFGNFYELSVVGMAVFWFMPFVELLRLGSDEKFRSRPWRVCLPDSAIPKWEGQRLRRGLSGMVLGVAGFLLMTGFFVVLGFGLLKAGSFGWAPPASRGWQVVGWMLVAALFLAVLKELLFRGIALGIFMRAMPPVLAIVLSALLFAAVHFLLPIAGVTVADPDVKRVGFELLGKLAMRFGDWQALLADFSVLFAVGVLLGYARWRTASLWLPVGLQTGWIFAEWMFGSFTVMVERRDSVARVLSGESIQQGVIPLVGVTVIGLLIYVFTNLESPENEKAAEDV